MTTTRTFVPAKVFMESIGSLTSGGLDLLANLCNVLCLDGINGRMAKDVIV